MKKAITFLVLLSFIISCRALPHKARAIMKAATREQADLTTQEERRMTEETFPQMKKEFPPAKSPELQQYISDLGMKIIRANNLEGNPYNYNFTVVDVEDVNAFALPADTVFVTAPLIAMMANEAELAGAIGHEVGHIIARHAAERMYGGRRIGRWSKIGT